MKVQFGARAGSDSPEKPLGLCNFFKTRIRTDSLRTSKKQNAALAQREVESGDGRTLSFRAQVDQKVSTRNHVQA
jgi:hypothetical protein